MKAGVTQEPSMFLIKLFVNFSYGKDVERRYMKTFISLLS